MCVHAAVCFWFTLLVFCLWVLLLERRNIAGRGREVGVAPFVQAMPSCGLLIRKVRLALTGAGFKLFVSETNFVLAFFAWTESLCLFGATWQEVCNGNSSSAASDDHASLRQCPNLCRTANLIHPSHTINHRKP